MLHTERTQTTYFEEIFDSLWIVAVAFSADTFNFLDLAGLACCLNVLEVNFGVLREVDNGPQEVK